MPASFPLYDSAKAGDLPGVKQHLTAGNVNQKDPEYVSKAKHTRDVSKFLRKGLIIKELRYEQREHPHPQKPPGHIVHLR